MKSPSHLNALRAFEATARLGGYVAAAQEIGVTPEAVGQLVRNLEAYLEIQLFHRGRKNRRLVPTREAETVLPSLTDAIKVMAGTMDRLRALSRSGVLTLTLAPSIAAKWLVPRLPAFLSIEPDIDVRLDITADVLKLESGQADLAIRYGRSGAGGNHAKILFEDEKLLTVCSPDFLASMPAVHTPQGLSECVLIHDVTIDDRSFPTWRDWFRMAGVVGDEKAKFLEFNAALTAIDAAVLGQGVALVREQLVKGDLKEGRLISLFPDCTLTTGWNYYVVMADDARREAHVFADWLVAQSVADTQADVEGRVC